MGYTGVMFQKHYVLVLFEVVSRPEQFDAFLYKIRQKNETVRAKK